jgi:3-isopropylmalate dehydratase small subunit
MQPFTTLSGRAVPFGAANVDTDVIIPARFLKAVTREGLGKGALRRCARTRATCSTGPRTRAPRS